MAGDADLLTRKDPDLDVVVFLAEASGAAYPTGDAQGFVAMSGLTSFTSFESGNVQGYYCSTQQAALLVFRGTSNIGQWIRDARILPAPFRDWGWAHLGFVKGIDAVETFLQQFDQIAKSKARVWVAGHSLGGALAVLAAARLKSLGVCTPSVLTYGQPAAGFADFVARFNSELPLRLWHIINQQDIVPRIPPLPYHHCNTAKRILRPGVFEATQGFESAAAPSLPEPLDYSQAETFDQIIPMNLNLEGLEAARGGLVLETDAPPQLDAFEFGRLQLALGAGEPAGLEGMALEGAIPFLGDHSISEYIRLLKDIRDAATRG
jgi:pimeloyl-ACP methyl ester carboxylesterase